MVCIILKGFRGDFRKVSLCISFGGVSAAILLADNQIETDDDRSLIQPNPTY